MLNDNSISTGIIWENFVYAEQHVKGLTIPFVVDDVSEGITDDPQEWSIRYFHECVLSLETNFNAKRFKNILKVRDHLRDQGEPDFQRIEQTMRSK